MDNQTPSLKRPIPIRVECYAGYRDEQTPEKFFLRDQMIEVVEILDRWIGPDHRYFKVRSHDRDLYILRYDILALQWELSLFTKEAYLIGHQPDTAYAMEGGDLVCQN